MYSDDDLERAVAAGVLDRQAVAAFREHVARGRATPAADEEHFRLVTGFNDIFVSIAAILLLLAVGWIGSQAGLGLGGLAVAAASWGLAEYFTRRRHMALPSILLLVTFVYGVAGGLLGMLGESLPSLDDRSGALTMAAVAAITAGAAWAHWRRFHVPITIAAGAGAVVGLVVALVLAAVPGAREVLLPLLLVAGLGLFAFAMWWDMSDRARRTGRSDVAFWLHLMAAPMIAHPIFAMLGVLGGEAGAGRAGIVILLYVGFGLVALAVDRRALLVSSLFYVLYAMSSLFERFGAVGLNLALTGLVIGSALLTLSAFWHAARAQVVRRLPPALQAKLPLVAADRVPRGQT
jgi:hypothetical protein